MKFKNEKQRKAVMAQMNQGNLKYSPSAKRGGVSAKKSKKPKYEVTIDTGKPYTVHANSKKELFKLLAETKQDVQNDDAPYCDVLITEKGKDKTDDLFDEFEDSFIAKAYQWDESGGKKKKLRWVYGTKDKKWHLVDKSDRDFEHGISQEKIRKIGFDKAKEEYLSARFV